MSTLYIINSVEAGIFIDLIQLVLLSWLVGSVAPIILLPLILNNFFHHHDDDDNERR